MEWILVTPDGVFSHRTKINGRRLQTEFEICRFMRAVFCKINRVKSFSQWADEMNEDPNFWDDGVKPEHPKFDAITAIEDMSSLFHLNVNGKHVRIYEFFEEYYAKPKAKEVLEEMEKELDEAIRSAGKTLTELFGRRSN